VLQRPEITLATMTIDHTVTTNTLEHTVGTVTLDIIITLSTTVAFLFLWLPCPAGVKNTFVILVRSKE
jgi:hypothetical protein